MKMIIEAIEKFCNLLFFFLMATISEKILIEKMQIERFVKNPVNEMLYFVIEKYSPNSI